MYRLTERPRIRAIEYIHRPGSSLLAAQLSPTDKLAVRAAIFRTIGEDSYLLVVQRAASDSLPNKWELPGGGVAEGDDCVLDAIAREVKEETGLTVSWVTQEVGPGQRYTKTLSEGKVIRNLVVTFLVETEQIEFVERGGGEGSSGQGVSRLAPSEALGAIPIQLDAAEHQRFLWLSRAEVERRQSAADNSEVLEFTGESQQTMLAAFELQKEVLQARARI